MRAHLDEELDLVAAEYVLGTLAPDEAARFEARLADEPAARAAKAEWETHLARLGENLVPVSPPPPVWDRITARTGIAGAPHAGGRSTARSSAPRRGARRRDRRAGRWRASALAASAIALVLAVSLFVMAQDAQSPASTGPAFASLIYDKPTGSSWLVTEQSAARSKLSVEALRSYPLPKGKVLKLWIKHGDTSPLLVGTLPANQGKYAMPLSERARREMANGARLMVSMENNGFHADAPQGRIMWMSPIASRTG